MNETPEPGATAHRFTSTDGDEPPVRSSRGTTPEQLPDFNRLSPQAVFDASSIRLDVLLHNIGQGLLALPGFARPFSWRGHETARLIDSLFNGYPAGLCIVWEYRPPALYRAIAAHSRHAPSLVLIDGRQRLTALYSALRGAPARREGQEAARIQVAFCPRTASFVPAGPKTRGNPEYIEDISGLWLTPSSSRKIASAFLARLGRETALDDTETERICRNIDRLLDLTQYSFPVLELPAWLTERQAWDIYTRVNNGERTSAKPARQARHGARMSACWPRLIVANSHPGGQAFTDSLRPMAAGQSQTPVPQPAKPRDAVPAGDTPAYPARSIVAL